MESISNLVLYYFSVGMDVSDPDDVAVVSTAVNSCPKCKRSFSTNEQFVGQ